MSPQAYSSSWSCSLDLGRYMVQNQLFDLWNSDSILTLESFHICFKTKYSKIVTKIATFKFSLISTVRLRKDFFVYPIRPFFVGPML
jgi:hypothetical protein